LQTTQERLDEARREEIKAIEDKKNVQIETLTAEHQKAFADIKNYYNDITHNNLDLIRSLKEEVKELEAEEQKDEMRLQEKLNENKKLSAPLKKMQQELTRLQEEHKQYQSEKAELLAIKASLLVVEDELRALTWDHEVLRQRYDALEAETRQLQDRYMTSVYDVKQKSGLRGLLLEKRIQALFQTQEELQAELHEILSRVNLEPSMVNQVCKPREFG